MDLYVIRHQESEDNAAGILQGSQNDSPLTITGRRQAHYLAERINHRHVDMIWSSPLMRAIQTAAIISQSLDTKVMLEPSLTEIDTGVLAGDKDYIQRTHPDYLAIWHKRGDLDGIPRAETGDKVQARALYFLSRYLDAGDGADIMVSHAGLIRSLVNTARGLPRTTMIDPTHASVHSLHDPLKGVSMKKLLALNSTVYKIGTADGSYILKRSHATSERLDAEKAIVEHVNRDGQLMPPILYHGMYGADAAQVMPYMPGEHKYGNLPPDMAERLIVKTHALQNALRGLPRNLMNRSLDDVLRSAMKNIADSQIGTHYRTLLQNPAFQRMMEEEQHASHYDLHRHNILFCHDGDVRFLDAESIILAPEGFTAASLMLATFMLEEYDSFDEKSLLSKWPDRLESGRMLPLMMARAIKGASFFGLRMNAPDVSDLERGLFSKYSRCLDRIKKRMEEAHG